MFGLLALLCVLLGFIVAIFNVDILFPPIVWYVAAIALAHLGPLELPAVARRRRDE
jgi:Flp pilus assembly protein TadB